MGVKPTQMPTCRRLPRQRAVCVEVPLETWQLLSQKGTQFHFHVTSSVGDRQRVQTRWRGQWKQRLSKALTAVRTGAAGRASGQG